MEYRGPARVISDGTDLGEIMVVLGTTDDERVASGWGGRMANSGPLLWGAAGTRIDLELPDGTFDLVMDFGIIHHVPNWRDALAEVHRTLRPGGEFLFEELPLETWERGIGVPFKRIADHPYDEMFRKQEFVDELKALGFAVEVHETSPLSFYHFWGRAGKLS